MGWSNRAAVCLAVEKTGNIITAAGLIMSISFAGDGLLLLLSLYLNRNYILIDFFYINYDSAKLMIIILTDSLVRPSYTSNNRPESVWICSIHWCCNRYIYCQNVLSPSSRHCFYLTRVWHKNH